ncbi:MAG: mechanosensitive ion channel [Saprospiraceae bacterium]|nr:mechanosensitive ion channel [Saprospiraceae bacterium]
METNSYLDKVVDFCWTYGPKTLGAIVIFVIGWWIIRRLTTGFDRFLRARKVDAGLRPFFTSLTDTGMKVVLIFMVANTIGIETTSFIAIFSAIAFSVGLALQGSLGNFASGVLILLFKPFKVGDLLSAAGHMGKVTEIQIFSTVLKTPSGKKVIIPNGKMTEGPIENIAEDAEVQAEAALLVNSDTSLEKLRQVVMAVAEKCPFAIQEKQPEVKVRGISRDDMKVEIAVWTLGITYEDTQFFLYEELHRAFEAEGIVLAKERRKESV